MIPVLFPAVSPPAIASLGGAVLEGSFLAASRSTSTPGLLREHGRGGVPAGIRADEALPPERLTNDRASGLSRCFGGPLVFLGCFALFGGAFAWGVPPVLPRFVLVSVRWGGPVLCVLALSRWFRAVSAGFSIARDLGLECVLNASWGVDNHCRAKEASATPGPFWFGSLTSVAAAPPSHPSGFSGT